MRSALSTRSGRVPLRLLPGLPLLLLVVTFALAQSAEPIREVWRRPLGSVQCLAISPDGARVAVVTWASEVICWEASRERWRRTLPGAEIVALGSEGRAVVYTPLDALRRDLLLIDARGRPEGRLTAGGPVSSLCLSPDGRFAAVGTVGGSVELHPLKSRARPRRLDLPGACQQLSYDLQGYLVVTTVDPARLLLFNPDGERIWQVPAPTGGEFRIGTPTRTAIQGASDVITLAAVVATGRSSARPAPPPLAARPGGVVRTGEAPAEVTISSRARAWLAPGVGEIQLVGIGPTGKLLWRRTLKGRSPSLRVMPSIGQLVVGYERADRRKSTVRHDRVIACFGPNGADKWEKGGMVYDPLLVSASPGGETVLSLCAGNRFWLLSGSGHQLWSYTTQSRVRMARASASGSSVAVTTSNGQLLLLTINPGAGDSRRQEADLARREMETSR